MFEKHLDPMFSSFDTETIWPWLVYVHMQQLKHNSNTELGVERFLCVGTLVSGDSVLTTASCVHALSLESVRVSVRFAGDPTGATFGQETNTEGRMHVESMSVHRKFEPAIKKNDLAVLKLAHHVNFTSTLYPACLAARNVGWDETNNTLLTVGW